MIKLTNEQLKELANTSAYTITGAGGNLNEWIEGYNKMLKEQEIGEPKEWYTFSGKQMNEVFDLSGDNQYNSSLTFLAFPLDNLNVGKLAIFKLRMQDRWFDGIVENNREREEELV